MLLDAYVIIDFKLHLPLIDKGSCWITNCNSNRIRILIEDYFNGGEGYHLLFCGDFLSLGDNV